MMTRNRTLRHEKNDSNALQDFKLVPFLGKKEMNVAIAKPVFIFYLSVLFKLNALFSPLSLLGERGMGLACGQVKAKKSGKLHFTQHF